MFLGIINVYKQIMLIHIQFVTDAQLCNMMTIISSTVDNCNAIQFELVSRGWADLWQIILQQNETLLLSSYDHFASYIHQF